jgi:hypothetical protein
MVNRGMLSWGVFLLSAGGVMLLAQAGILDRGLVGQALGLWPLLLVAIGAKLLLRRTQLALPSAVVAAVIPGLLLGGLVVAVPNVTPACKISQPESVETRQGTFGGTASAELSVSCGELTVTTVPGSEWLVRTGRTNGPAPVLDASGQRLHLASNARTALASSSWGGDDFDVQLPTANPIDLSAEVNAGRGQFDLAGAHLGRVQVDINAGEATVDLTGATLTRLSMDINAAGATVRLPSGSDFTSDLTVNAGRLIVCAPAELGVRLHQKVILGSSLTNGLVRMNGFRETPNYALATSHADLTIAVNLGSVDINPEGGCK